MRKASILLFFGLLMACQSDKTLEMHDREYTGAACESCPSVRVSIVEAMGNSPLDASINTAQREEIISLLDYDQETDASNIEEAITTFQEGFRKMQEEFPEELTGWEAAVETEFGFSNAHVVSLKMKTYVFTGGAHGFPATRYLNFDHKTGKELDGVDLFKDPEAFAAFAESSFRQQYGIPSDAPINSTGFMFEDNLFKLPQNIGFENEGMVLHYNPYEAASYADGALILEFPYEEVRPFLAWEQ